MSGTYRIAIIGSGPAGLSAAAHAAELGLSHVLLEAEQHASNTLFKYQKGKHVMAEPGVLPLRSPLAFEAGTRESILEGWNQSLHQHQVNVRYGANVTGVSGQRGDFLITLANGGSVQAQTVVLAIGLQGNIRKFGVPGEDLPNVQYQLDDPDEYADETIVVAGGGDAGIENALALAAGNRVFVINREEEFNRCKDANLGLLKAAIADGRIEPRSSTAATRIEAQAEPALPLCFVAQTPQGEERIPCHRVIGRLGASPPRALVESFGVVFPSKDRNAVPAVSDHYESNVPGIYIIGALGGYPLIKQALNQGYEVVEYILGNAVEPADEPLLKAKFAGYRSAGTVSEAIARIQAAVPLLSGLTTLQLREFLLDSQIHLPKDGETVFRRNDYTNSLYCIVEGEVSVLPELADDDTRIRLAAGAFFGEMGLISGRRRNASVVAGPGCVLVETPRRSMLKLLGSVESVKHILDQASVQRAVQAFLGASVSDTELHFLAQGAQIRSFAAGQVLFQEGDQADGLYLIRRGSVTVSRLLGGREIVLSYVAAGNYVGEMALISSAPRSATVRAAVATEAVVLTSERVKRVLAGNESLRAGVDAMALGRMQDNLGMEHDAAPGDLINFLMKQGLGEATDVLLIDASLCVRCDNCEKACADTHGGTSRLDREAGPTFAQIHVPTSCRHCEHPHCMKDCPPDAIHRSADGEVFISDSCIGCGNCERNCPYGVIRMAPVQGERRSGGLLSWLLLGLGDEPGTEPKAVPGAKTKKVAVKCDMCKDLAAGPACVRSCPTGAAIRTTPERFLDFAAKRDSR
ncbi:MAG: cyclic nucleotide-binding domain-containing protein [Arenimonas sp.]|uniref:cyclic nucleotide-binding domain-containing protein n=1 Tax=Arenimonas sp. TaxID=1872635 RepID=UPI0025BC8D35|nr:cyclic nucleotide-binding domain-containing protein [Arenimonas sp.]MBW8367456.1 cyclic nucleotide-binding domain-containing protein [Arenimonas sp.]